VDFNNPTRIEPFLDIEAETRIRVPQETYQVTLRITGPLATPNFSFNSDPPLGEVEILALVFSDVSPGGNAELRQFDELTPQQRLFRERAARALTSVLSTEVSRVVEETFGVDTFQITPSLQDPNTQSSSAALDPGMRLTVLKRLSERLYLTYSRSLSSSSRDNAGHSARVRSVGSALLDPVAQRRRHLRARLARQKNLLDAAQLLALGIEHWTLCLARGVQSRPPRVPRSASRSSRSCWTRKARSSTIPRCSGSSRRTSAICCRSARPARPSRT
jgi:hypothetical protein